MAVPVDPVTDQLQRALGSTYDLGPLLGRGGMGLVYRATDRRLRRQVAIKVLPPELGYSDKLRARFVREAQTAAGLAHPNVVPIYDVGEHEGLVWFVMALVEGESLRAKVERDGPLPIGQIRRVLEEVAQALAYAHAREIVHRDIKPDNILLDRASGRALVTDFGIAKVAAADETELTQSGAILGTARYMAPEQALGAATVDSRADMYALGLVGYFMLTGSHAIAHTTLPAVIAMHVRGMTIDLGSAGRRMPSQLVAALSRCLENTPADRFTRMEELAEALRDLGGQSLEVPPQVRQFLRETEHLFTMGCTGMIVLGVIGVKLVPPELVVLLGLNLLWPWVKSMERLNRAGLGWGHIRRALHLEQMRRVQEKDEELRQPPGAVSMTLALTGIVVILVAGGSGLLERGTGTGTVDLVLLMSGLAGICLAPIIFSVWRANAPRLTSTYTELLLMGIATAVVAGIVLEEWAAAGLAIAITGLAVVAVVLWRRRVSLPVNQDKGRSWTVPRWLDTLGSWLLARVLFEGTRLHLERDTVAGGTIVPPLRESRALLRRVMRARRAGKARQVGVMSDAIAAEMLALASSLAHECRSIVRGLNSLQAHQARLNDAVMLTRSIDAGSSDEGELQRVERKIDSLRKQYAEQVQALQALAGAVEILGRGGDTTDLQAAIDRARALFDQDTRPTLKEVPEERLGPVLGSAPPRRPAPRR